MQVTAKVGLIRKFKETQIEWGYFTVVLTFQSYEAR